MHTSAAGHDGESLVAFCARAARWLDSVESSYGEDGGRSWRWSNRRWCGR
ncbi:hypothetical protein AB0L71_23635 [Streptomyces sp. NPDC052052]